MVPGLPRPPNGNDSRPVPRSLEELMAAPVAPDPEAGLSARGAFHRELGRRMMIPLDELVDLLREGGA